MIPEVRANHQRLICVSRMPFPGIPSGRMTSKADSRSVATSRRASPRSKISRTFPDPTFGNARSIDETASPGNAASISAKIIRRGFAGSGAGPEGKMLLLGWLPGLRCQIPRYVPIV